MIDTLKKWYQRHLTVEGHLAQGKDQSRYLADSANAGDNETH